MLLLKRASFVFLASAIAAAGASCKKDASPEPVQRPIVAPLVQPDATLSRMVHRVPWERVERTPTGIRVQFVQSPERRCGQLQRVEVKDSGNRVKIGIWIGSGPREPGKDQCILLGQLASVDVKLPRPDRVTAVEDLGEGSQVVKL